MPCAILKIIPIWKETAKKTNKEVRILKSYAEKMSTLTSRQRNELNKAISSYLKPLLDPKTLDEVNVRLDLTEEDLKQTSDNSILEKKWSTVIRLQRKIIDLEAQIKNLNSIIDSNSGMMPSGDRGSILSTSGGFQVSTKVNWLPSRVNNYLKAHKASINAIDIHPFLPELAAGLNDGSIVIWDLLNPLQPQKVINAHTKAINDITYCLKPVKLGKSPQNSILLASCSSDLYIKIWDTNNDYNLEKSLSGHSHTVSSVQFKPNDPGHLFSSSRDGSIIHWDVINGFRLKSFVGHSDWVRSLDITVNGEYLVSCSNDQSARLSHGDSGNGLAIMVGHTHVIEDCKFAPRAAWKHLDSLPNTVKNAEMDNEYDQLNYKYCATCSRDETIKIWLLPVPIIRPHRAPVPPSNPSAVCVAELRGHSSWVRSVQFHPGGKYLFSSSDDKSIKIWDLSAIPKLGIVKCIRTLTGHEGFVNCIKFADPIFVNQSDNTENKHFKMTEDELDKSIRPLFVSGGTDNLICTWS